MRMHTRAQGGQVMCRLCRLSCDVCAENPMRIRDDMQLRAADMRRIRDRRMAGDEKAVGSWRGNALITDRRPGRFDLARLPFAVACRRRPCLPGSLARFKPLTLTCIGHLHTFNTDNTLHTLTTSHTNTAPHSALSLLRSRRHVTSAKALVGPCIAPLLSRASPTKLGNLSKS